MSGSVVCLCSAVERAEDCGVVEEWRSGGGWRVEGGGGGGGR